MTSASRTRTRSSSSASTTYSEPTAEEAAIVPPVTVWLSFVNVRAPISPRDCDSFSRQVRIKSQRAVHASATATIHQNRSTSPPCLATKCDDRDEHHIVRMLDHFVHRSHLCGESRCSTSTSTSCPTHTHTQRGLNAGLVRYLHPTARSWRFSVLRNANVILRAPKPENILVKSLDTGEIKLIDFGSACFENRTVYAGRTSRADLRFPEVVLGSPY